MSRILLTGGAGFIGSHIAKALLERGDNVVVVDNFNDYYDPKLKRDRIKYLLGDHKNYRILETDVADYAAMEGIFKTNNFDKVCHLAAQAGVRYSLINPFSYERANILGFLNILELCRHYNVKDLIFASSSSIYGGNKKMPFSEEDNVDHPISLYAASKKSNEEMAYAYHHLFGINCTGLRLFTVYGPWGRPDMAAFLFAKNIILGKPIEVFNQGDMARDFTYITDIVNGAVAAIDKSYPYEIFNLARGESIELIDYIEEIRKNLGREIRMNMLPIQPGDVKATSADISKARKMLGYEPQVSIAEGIRKFVEWYMEYYRTE
jgi:UDP-glucuronate 4-epimerase